MKPRKLTDAQVEWVREIGRRRRLLPTQSELARELGVSKRLIEEIQSGKQYVKQARSFTAQEIEALCAGGPMFPVNP